jgi:hypothetical protein
MFTTIDCSCSCAVVSEAVSVSPNQEAAREPEKDRKWPATKLKLGGWVLVVSDGDLPDRSIVFRHLSPAAFCKRLVLTVDSTVNCCDHSEKSNYHQHLDRLETIEWE